MRTAILLIAFLFAGCTQSRVSDDLAPFRSLKRGMTMEQVRAGLGQPSRETGSGLAIDVYQLRDRSEVWLGYAGQGGLIYVQHGSDQLLPEGGG